MEIRVGAVQISTEQNQFRSAHSRIGSDQRSGLDQLRAESIQRSKAVQITLDQLRVESVQSKRIRIYETK
ncbi:hypothetical protein F511_07723 [Dorcoceras hygrometricum]|uniref:Uncharacterized protein n=1 Tax=Dorcoceras hygrometricum TaxID=472368 RepID=A0A2Z7CJL3_9LAMI|nr:hypothetical protein F511_07723 [Dorcoceras hygrometricum]